MLAAKVQVFMLVWDFKNVRPATENVLKINQSVYENIE